MLFKKTDELKVGMRLARPIYNKNGVLLYERNSRLSMQGILSIRNFGLIGIYILEPAEPIPPMTLADLEFERFQTMCVFSIADELGKISHSRKQSRMAVIVADIIKNYGRQEKKINFVQNLRSNEDYIFKHTMNVAILAALMANKMKLKPEEQNETVIAALVHDIGKLNLPARLIAGAEQDVSADDQLNNAMKAGYALLEEAFPANPGVRKLCSQFMKLKEISTVGHHPPVEEKYLAGARILLVAEIFDTMTAMHYGRPPASEVAAVKHLLERPEIYSENVVRALIDSINILIPGVSVELNNGDKALILAENTQNILRPMVLNFRDNKVIDLANRHSCGKLGIVDIMKTMDNRHVMDIAALRRQGFQAEEPELVQVKGE